MIALDEEKYAALLAQAAATETASRRLYERVGDAQARPEPPKTYFAVKGHIEEHPGTTSHNIVEALSLSRNTVGKRISELHSAGLISRKRVRGETRYYSRTA